MENGSSSSTCKERMDVQTHGFQTSSLRSCERLSFCGFTLPSLRRLLQQCRGTGETVQLCFHLTGMDSEPPKSSDRPLCSSNIRALGRNQEEAPPSYQGSSVGLVHTLPSESPPRKVDEHGATGFSSFLMATPTQSLRGAGAWQCVYSHILGTSCQIHLSCSLLVPLFLSTCTSRGCCKPLRWKAVQGLQACLGCSSWRVRWGCPEFLCSGPILVEFRATSRWIQFLLEASRSW